MTKLCFILLALLFLSGIGLMGYSFAKMILAGAEQTGTSVQHNQEQDAGKLQVSDGPEARPAAKNSGLAGQEKESTGANDTLVMRQKSTTSTSTAKKTNNSPEKIVSGTPENKTRPAQDNETSNATSANKTPSTGPALTGNACLDAFGIQNSTIIFYYSQEDPYSTAMMPIVSDLESKYSFYKTSELWNKTLVSCFGFDGKTPAFVCAGSKQKIVGKTTRQLLEDFAKECG